MAADTEELQYQFQISLSVLNHLGRNLYRSFITVLSEAISNSWDAGAENVWIHLDRESSTFWILDDGAGMSPNDFQNKFLKIGYSKRKEYGDKSSSGRPFIGAKGIGKLALLSCAQRITVISKTATDGLTGGTIDNLGLDAAITDDLIPDDYPLEDPDYNLLKLAPIAGNSGTAIFFEKTKDQIRNSEQQIRKLIALSFRFFLLDNNFSIFVNGKRTTVEDLSDLCNATQFLWTVNGYTDDFTNRLTGLREAPRQLSSSLGVKGFLATVVKPRDLKITGTDERATVDLFVNGRLRERNILRHIPTQRIVESYLYGQIHFDEMDGGGVDPFTSSREGVIEDDVHFQALLDLLRRDFIPQVIDEWDELRLKYRDSGDDENARRSKKDRKISEVYTAAAEDFGIDGNIPAQNNVDKWIAELAPDAEYNISSYVDCFLAENLVRRYLDETKTPLSTVAVAEATKWKDIEEKRKQEANLSFEIRKNASDSSYLGMDELSISAEGDKMKEGKPTPLFADAISYRPVRNVVGHTGLLTGTAKAYLTLRLENIKARLKKMLQGSA